MKHPWEEPQTEEQVHIHNARVAISRAEDEIACLDTPQADVEMINALDEISEAISLANDILIGLFDHVAPIKKTTSSA